MTWGDLPEEAVGGIESQDAVGGEQGRETFLPAVVTAFDFAFCLRGGREAQGDAVKWSAVPRWVKASWAWVKKKE